MSIQINMEEEKKEDNRGRAGFVCTGWRSYTPFTRHHIHVHVQYACAYRKTGAQLTTLSLSSLLLLCICRWVGRIELLGV